MDRKIIGSAAVFGALGIVLGAFGAHALKKVLEPESLAAFETGVKYQMYHSLFLLFIGITPLVTQKAKKTLLILIVSGIIFFSGSIYLLAAGPIISIDFKPFGFITPIGGLLLIAAWVVLFLQIIRRKI